MARPLLITFVDIPGSGKTTFAKQLADKIGAVVLSSDGMRLAMWGSIEAIRMKHSDPEEHMKANQAVFGAMNYTTSQILQAGQSVIYDANQSHRRERQDKYDIAKAYGAVPVLVRVKVPYEVSLQRIQGREASSDARRISADKARELLDTFASKIEEPARDEPIIELSGEVSFEEQYSAFEQGLRDLLQA